MKVYIVQNSGNAYKVRLLCSLLGVQYESIAIDLATGENRSPTFLKLSPRGQVPVVEDDGHVIWESIACMAYVARKYGGESWFPNEAAEMAQVLQWLAVATGEIHYGLLYARGILKGVFKGDYEDYAARGRAALNLLEERLKEHPWLALDRPTIGDIACYPYVMRAPEGDIPLNSYPAVQNWLQRIESLPGFLKL